MRRLLASLLILLTFSAAQAQIVGTLPFTFTNGTNADATQVMANYNFIINQVNANAANAGANATITSILGLTTPLSPGQGGSQYYTGGTSTGTANAQVVATGLTPAGFTLTSGKMVCFTPGFTNTGATTLTINGTASTALTRKVSSGVTALVGGELTTTQFACAQYDGTQYELLSTNAQPGNGGNPVNMTANTTVTPSQCGAFLETSGAGAFTVTLPTPVVSAYQSCRFDLWGNAAAAVTLSTPAGTFQGLGSSGAATQTIPPQFRGTLIADGANWLVTQHVRTDAPVNMGQAPTVQRFTTGTSLTYTPTAGFARIRVRMIAGGGGGGAVNTNGGATGGTTSFGGWTVIGGGGGQGGVAGSIVSGGTGGTGGATGTGTLIDRLTGAPGGFGNIITSAGVQGTGAGSPYGSGGIGLSVGGPSGGQAATYPGAGGAGGGTSNSGGGGGGAGEYVEFYMTASQVGASQTYTVGAAGAGGPAGTQPGGSGGAGRIVIEELYN